VRWKLGADEREAQILERILLTLEEILRRLPKPPEYQPTNGVSVTSTTQIKSS
jgi:hypothetical protein